MTLFRNYRLRNFNILLALSVILLTIFGTIVIGSANEAFQRRQLMGLISGLFVMIFFSVLSYSFLLRFYYLYYVGAIAILISVFIWGDTVGGATRWIDLNFVKFQPSELAKILLILFFSQYLMKYKEVLNTKKMLAITALLCAIPLILIIREPDLSTTIVTFLMLGSMLFYAGLSPKIVIGFFSCALLMVSYVIVNILRGSESVLMSYQGDRINAWLYPDKYPQLSYQQQNAIMAVGSGSLFGKGLYNTGVDSVKNGNYISEGQTDFIFAIVGEELGFIGSVAMILLLLIIAYQCIKTSKKAKDFAGEAICIGMGMLIAFQSFVNIGVVTGLLPNTGLTLPFVSYGLTSLLTLFFGMGIVLNVSLQSRKY